MTKRFGFTLAEVLITLGIIGVVAAMTIPNLIANTNSAKYSAQYRKTIATLNQAALMSQAQYDMNFANLSQASAVNQNPESTASLAALLNGTVAGGTYYSSLATLTYDKNGTTVQYAAPTTSSSGFFADGVTFNNAYLLADGSLFVFSSNAGVVSGTGANATGGACTVPIGTQFAPAANATPQQQANTVLGILKAHNCLGYIDVNGAALPNKEVSCSTATETTTNPSATCTIKKGDSRAVTDIFPVVFHDGVVEPATNAAKVILSQGK